MNKKERREREGGGIYNEQFLIKISFEPTEINKVNKNMGCNLIYLSGKQNKRDV